MALAHLAALAGDDAIMYPGGLVPADFTRYHFDLSWEANREERKETSINPSTGSQKTRGSVQRTTTMGKEPVHVSVTITEQAS